MKLSAYTKAKNCTDLADIDVGMNELQAFLRGRQSVIASKRLYNLSIKKQKLEFNEKAL